MFFHLIFVICIFCQSSLGLTDGRPRTRRKEGEFFSKRGRIVGLVTVISAFLAGYILHLFKKQSLTGFAIIFLVALVSRYVSCYFLNRMYEPPLEVKREHYFSFSEFVRRLNVGNFGKYVMFHSSFSFAVFLASPFFPVFMLRDLGFSYITYSIATTTVPLASIVAVSYWGVVRMPSGTGGL